MSKTYCSDGTLSLIVDSRFLLASLHIDSLKSKRTEGDIEEALQTIPKGARALATAYNSAIKRIEHQAEDDRNWARRVLCWVVHARRHLTPAELQHALVVREGDSEVRKKYLPSIGEVISLCAGLVAFNQESNVVQLVHYTAQQYFEDNKLQHNWICTAPRDITMACVTYLSFDAFETGFCTTGREFEERLQLHPFYDYAARNWGHHAHAASVEVEELILGFLQNEAQASSSAQVMMTPKDLISSSVIFHSWDYYSREVPKMTGGHIAAYFGLRNTIVGLLEKGHNLDVRDSDRRTPLSYAAQQGHEAVVEMLLQWGLEKGHNLDVRDSDRRTPLSYAAQQGHEAVVEMLLQRGAQLNSKGKYGNFVRI